MKRAFVVDTNPLVVQLCDSDETVEPEKSTGNHMPHGWHGTLDDNVFHPDSP